jgi:sulfate transport system ATP-binding protein
VRPHDIEVVPFVPGAQGLTAVVRYIHAAGPQARLSLEQVQSREPVEVEIARSELETLKLKHGDLVSLRLRQGKSFTGDYTI